MWIMAGLFGVAVAAEVPEWSGDVGLTYGRNWGQDLMIGGVVGEFKRNFHPQAALGVRIGSTLGVGANATAADQDKGYFGVPLLLKGEEFLNRNETRPFVGIGAGVTLANGGGTIVVDAGGDTRFASYRSRAPIFTVMPELGIDLGVVRVSLQHSFLFGSSRAAVVSVDAADTTVAFGRVPGLSGTTLQAGMHFGGPRDEGVLRPVGR